MFLKKDMFVFDSQMEYVSFVKALGLKKLLETFEEITGVQDDRRNMLILAQILGAIFLPLIMEPLIQEISPFQLPDIDQHIDIVFSHYFPS